MSNPRGDYGASYDVPSLPTGSAPSSARLDAAGRAEHVHAAWAAQATHAGVGRVDLSPGRGCAVGLNAGLLGGAPAFSAASNSSATSSPRNNMLQGASPQQHSGTATAHGQVPLRAALHQLRNVTDSLVPQGRRSSPSRRSASARNSTGRNQTAAGSPSPDRGRARPPEDKYLKILQSLQAKGAAGGGLAASLLEGAGVSGTAGAAANRRQRFPANQTYASSDSDSSDNSFQRARQRKAAGRPAA